MKSFADKIGWKVTREGTPEKGIQTIFNNAASKLANEPKHQAKFKHVKKSKDVIDRMGQKIKMSRNFTFNLHW